MNSRFKIAAMVMVVGVLCVAGVAPATDFVWDGDGLLPHEGAPALWTEPLHWVQASSYPLNTNDNATVTDPYPSSTCTYNPSPGVWINQLTVGGVSPTKMTLHVRDDTLIANEMYLQDYAELDVDQNVSVFDHTELSGDVWVDVAAGKTFNALAQGHPHAAVHVKSAYTRLHLTGVFVAAGIVIDGDADNEPRSLKLDGGTLTITGYSDIAVISDPDVDNKRAKFWLASGTITWNAASYVEMVGGDRLARRAELDLDQDLELYQSAVYLPGYTMIDGYASIDIAAGKKFTMPRLTIGELGNPSVVKLRVATGAVMNVCTGDE